MERAMVVSGERMVMWLGLLIGVALAGVLVVDTWRLPPGTGVLGADVTVTLAPPGELAILPERRVVTATALGAAPTKSHDTGSVGVRNLSGSTFDVSARALPSSRDLDDALSVAVRAGNRSLYSGTLDGLRAWTRQTFTLARGERTPLTVTVSIPTGTPPREFRGRIEDITLELRTAPRATT